MFGTVSRIVLTVTMCSANVVTSIPPGGRSPGEGSI
jgi:hypothetical protein